MCSVSGKWWWSHCWTKWSKADVTAHVSNVRWGTKSDVMLQHRSCVRCGETEMRKVIGLAELME